MKTTLTPEEKVELVCLINMRIRQAETDDEPKVVKRLENTKRKLGL